MSSAPGSCNCETRADTANGRDQRTSSSDRLARSASDDPRFAGDERVSGENDRAAGAVDALGERAVARAPSSERGGSGRRVRRRRSVAKTGLPRAVAMSGVDFIVCTSAFVTLRGA